MLDCVERITAVSARTNAGAAVRSSEMRRLASLVRIFFAARCEMQWDDLSGVRPDERLAPQQQSFFQPIDQLDHAVMAQLHALGQFPNAGFAAGRQTAQGKEQHVLLRLEIRLARGFFAAIQENSYLISKFREGAELRCRHRCGGHDPSVSHPDINAISILQAVETVLKFLSFRAERGISPRFTVPKPRRDSSLRSE